ncbi:MAG: glycoside hydrolase family 16 protein, partial [Rhodococcus sp.]|nr:glycoside hydrolase family 16 protein [Rhodococcus sp. (in: high G+C Gram-positive bacteria)]
MTSQRPAPAKHRITRARTRLSRTTRAALSTAALTAALVATTTMVTMTPGTAQPSSPSGQPVPTGNLPGWRHIFADDFTKDAPVGSWANECSPDTIVYTGAQGQKWRTYPRCYVDTYQKRPYRSDRVLSVRNGVLDFHLHPVDGQPAGANPSPLIDGVSQYQTYGRYSARMRVDTDGMDEYHVAWLLWPQSERWPEDGEFDFPEGALSGNALGYHHYAGAGSCADCQEVARDVGARFTDWHTYTIEWMPGRVRYLLDDVVVLDSTNWVPDGPMRWQLQTETNGTGNSSGHLEVDWVSVWAYDGATPPAPNPPGPNP